ncbi:MAG: TRAP transporter fused permease subunit [Pseudomonadota bacterium]
MRGRIQTAAAVGAATISVLTLVWASGLPLMVGIRVWTEQLLLAAAGLAITICLLTRSFRGRPRQATEAPVHDRILAAVALCFCVYLTLRFPYLSDNLFYAQTEALIVSCLGLALLLEAVRRAVGWPLIVILLAICLYALFSSHLSGPLQSRSIAPDRLITFAVLDSASMVGAALTIAVVVVVPFIILARLLMASGGSAFFSDLSVALLGGTRGGAGKIAVLGSAFFGSISGSAVSNVASTGGITIPLMTKAGYRPKTAAAIEAAASTGGQLVPPIMGAAAFLLAENLRVAYSDVVIAALVPACLFYVSLLAFADFEAARRNIQPIEGERPTVSSVLLRGWFVLLPFAILIVGLFSLNMRPETAALSALGALLVISLFRTYGGSRIKARELVSTLTDAGRTAVDIILICAVASIVIGIFNLSGLSFGLTFFLVQVGQGSLLMLLALTAVLCIILGMGLPTVGVYLLLSALAAPPLIELGVAPMAAHLFVLYFGMMSMITPPVAIAAFVAANMARAPTMATAFEAVRVGWTAYIVPLLFVSSPALLLAAPEWIDSVVATLTAAGGICLVTAGVTGWFRANLNVVMRCVALIAGIALFIPHTMFDHAIALNVAAAFVAAGVWLVSPRLAMARAAPDGRP